MSEEQPPFAGSLSWEEKVFQADALWAQVKAALAAAAQELPKTPRRPDLRLIVNNTSGREVTFLNPGDHSNSKPEVIPADGENTAAMVMLAGDNLTDQQIHAFELARRFGLGEQGLTPEFIEFLGTPEAAEFIEEAYGPAPFEGQSAKLVPLNWCTYDGREIEIKPVFEQAAAYGARAAALEDAMLATVHIHVQGTKTVPEVMENSGMVIIVTEDWKTGAENTRPVVPSVAQDFYGRHYPEIPEVLVSTEGQVQRIDLKNGIVIHISPDGSGAVRVVREGAHVTDPDEPGAAPA